MTIEVSLLLTGVSVAFAVYFGIMNKSRNDRKDAEEHTEQQTANITKVMTKLENIAEDLKGIKREGKEWHDELQNTKERIVVLEQSLNRDDVKLLKERLTIVEQAMKSYHKRLDDITKKNDK